MGTLTLADFRSELLFDLKNRSDTSSPDGLTTTRQDMFINAGYLHVTHPTVFRHRELQYTYDIPLVAGTYSYTFTPDGSVNIAALRFVTYVDGATNDPTFNRTKLLPVDIQWTQERTHTTGQPRHYTIIGDQIAVFPVPDSTVAADILWLGAWREPTVLSATTDVTMLSTRWDEIVLLAARWRAELHLGYREMAEATKLDFVSLINEYKDFDQLHGEDWDWAVEVRNESYMERA